MILALKINIDEDAFLGVEIDLRDWKVLVDLGLVG